jgi:hypothetical protein
MRNKYTSRVVFNNKALLRGPLIYFFRSQEPFAQLLSPSQLLQILSQQDLSGLHLPLIVQLPFSEQQLCFFTAQQLFFALI